MKRKLKCVIKETPLPRTPKERQFERDSKDDDREGRQGERDGILSSAQTQIYSILALKSIMYMHAATVQGCLCDDGYEGHDCSLRTCPYGDDPDTHSQVR